MKKALYTEGSKPRTIFSIDADLDMIAQLTADGDDFDLEDIKHLVLKMLKEVSAAVAKGHKRREDISRD